MNKKAYYGQFGGQYVAESLMNTLQELDRHHFYYILGIDSCTIYFDRTPDEYFSTF